MKKAKILVYGAGPLGSIFAARLIEAGHDVSLLARGKRLADLRKYGIVLRDFTTGQETSTQVNVVENLKPGDVYDLILVIMRKNRALDILPALAASKQSSTILFLMNNAAGPGALVDALESSRVLTGFPASAGYFEGHVLVYLGGSEKHQMSIPIGEANGQIIERTRQIAQILESMRGYKVDIRTDMDAWHKSHVAVLMPGIGAALYACGCDRLRMARTRDALVLAIRATREAFRVLRALNVRIVPTWVKLFDWLPEPLMVIFLQRLLRNERMKVALEGHASAARDEIQHLVDELLALARSTNIATPDIDRLYGYFDPATPLIPDGSSEIAMMWW